MAVFVQEGCVSHVTDPHREDSGTGEKNIHPRRDGRLGDQCRRLPWEEEEEGGRGVSQHAAPLGR